MSASLPENMSGIAHPPRPAPKHAWIGWMGGRPARLFPFACLVALLAAQPTQAQIPVGNRPAYRSPMEVAYSPDGSLLAVADRTWPGLVLIKPSDGSVVREVKLLGDPTHVVWQGDGKVLVAEGKNGTVAEIDAASGTVLRRLPVGGVAKGLAVTPDGRLLTCDRSRNTLVILRLATGEREATLEVGREPGSVAVTPDGKYAVVGNTLPKPADPQQGTPAAELSLVDLASKQVTPVPLAKGATLVRQVVISPDGKWVYVTHQTPRGDFPVTQLENGWVMTNALSIIDLAARTLYASFVFDRSVAGAAHPWGAAIQGDGGKLWVSLEGVREIATVDLTALHTLLAGYSAKQRADLALDFGGLHTSGILKRTDLGNFDGPRGVALSPNGKALAVAVYFAGKVLLLTPDTLALTKAITLPENPAEDQIRKGERYYHSAMNCSQTWLSCSSCHDEGRTDGLSWDLSHDGTGNPKQTKSNIFASETPPSHITGSRENAEVATRAAYQFIEFQAAPEEQVQATYAFLKSLAPEPSPWLGPDGQLTPAAVEGKKLFEGQAGCSACHAGPYFTDLQKHDVGTRRSGTAGPDNNPSWDTKGYDTPTLIEVWRTAPYLHLGSALTVKDAILAHVKTNLLSPQQIDQVAAYAMQLGPLREGDLPLPIVPDAGTPTVDAPSPQVVPEAGVPAADVTPARPDGPLALDAGATPVVSVDPKTPDAGSGSPPDTGLDAPWGDGGGGDAWGSVKLTRDGLSCRMGRASPSRGGSLLWLVGLAWLVRRTRRWRR